MYNLLYIILYFEYEKFISFFFYKNFCNRNIINAIINEKQKLVNYYY